MLELIERKDFVINASYVEEDGTTDDVYNVYLEVLKYYLNHLENDDILEYDFDFSVENINYALKAVSYLVNLYMYYYDNEDGSVEFDLGGIVLRKEDLDENVDSHYHYYFYIKDLLNDETNSLIKFSKYILNDLELYLGDYYILFVYVLLKGELKYI